MRRNKKRCAAAGAASCLFVRLLKSGTFCTVFQE
jgi:hypothetical protein